FRKIQNVLGLSDQRQVILELAKGKLTTDPERHTGQGIFFTSRLLDTFDIRSGSVSLSHEFGEEEDWIFECSEIQGTGVFMRLANQTSRTAKSVFDQYSSGDDYGFTKTMVPVALARYGDERLI